MDSVGAVLGQSESCKTFVLFVLLTILIGLCCLSLSGCGLAGGLGETQGMTKAHVRQAGESFNSMGAVWVCSEC